MARGYRVVLAVVGVVLLLQVSAWGEALYVEGGVDVASEIVPLSVTQVAVTYPAGWSMVSLPLAPADPRVAAMFPDAISAFKFEGVYAQVTQMEVCKGYWLNLLNGGTYELAAAEGGDYQRQCSQTWPQGWSMMGVPYGGTTVGAIVQNPADNIISVFGFAGGYFQAADLEQGKGYWVNLQQAGALQLEGGGTGKVVAEVRREVPVTGSRLVVESGEQVATLSLGAAAELMVALPPLPPAGAFDARAEVGGVGTQAVPAGPEPMDYRVRLQGSDLVLRWEVEAADAGRWQLLVGETVYELQGVGSLALGAAAADLRLRYLPSVPGQWALLENYPNPFNPSTTIRYELAAAADVQLVIYDVLGQKVRSLVNMRQPGGAYSVVWDGRNAQGAQVANGIYFYELQAGEFRALRKMMLAK